MNQDPRVDAYIARKPDFAQPILERFRAAMHAACPEGEETLKWSAPSFTYRGEILAGMAAFKQHAAINFWRGSAVVGEEQQRSDAMGQFGRLASVDDMPSEAELVAFIHRAMALIDAGEKTPRNKTVKASIETPEDLREALADNAAAAATYDGFSPACRRDYDTWVLEAKRPETRAQRVAQAVAWMAEGKKRNWKYEKC